MIPAGALSYWKDQVLLASRQRDTTQAFGKEISPAANRTGSMLL
jgi:hypothetical protein